jgi:choice-of-anchor A domain-containing protein
MKGNLLFKILFVVCIFCSLKVQSQSPTAPAQGFNVFVQNGATFYTSETEGPVAMGGDLTIAGSYGVASHNNFSYVNSGLNIGLLVGGKVNYNGGNSLQVLNNGYVKIGNQNGSKAWYLDNNNSGSPIRITPGSDYNGSPNILLSAHASDLGNVCATNNPVFQSSPIDFAAAFTTLKSNSTGIANLAANADLTDPNGNNHSSSISTVLTYGQLKIKVIV